MAGFHMPNANPPPPEHGPQNCGLGMHVRQAALKIWRGFTQRGQFVVGTHEVLKTIVRFQGEPCALSPSMEARGTSSASMHAA